MRSDPSHDVSTSSLGFSSAVSAAPARPKNRKFESNGKIDHLVIDTDFDSAVSSIDVASSHA